MSLEKTLKRVFGFDLPSVLNKRLAEGRRRLSALGARIDAEETAEAVRKFEEDTGMDLYIDRTIQGK